ncbi:flagellar filament capping protein FliD [Caballeronia zhejiangensis]|uniref:Flagellar hook-associated protein 2 n=1 Tax=Caballeronia zhejiangensis TaxID=871203 RepID=A0A656QU46_9BURK|nr:flagellar filament capping protein FliD [Caballeronia zhejiangensis]KDR32910.1 flagellar hook protein FliD [Caballeronia zhejiangensis]MCG7399572.1 flagellar filament capping protein FliD [Caballeronia zhejiangensis]MCI1041906.1 flagellar filament capping protein FliD [Caballeronia zhejiangensis]
MTTVATTSASTVDPTSAVQQAAQSIISGSTNSTMDVNSLVTAIVNAKVAGQTDALNNKKTADNTQLTAIGTLKSVLSLMQSSLTNLSNGTALGAFAASADGKGITATADTSAVAGSYSVSVSNIASSQSLTSGLIPSGSLGTGSITLNLNGKSSTIKIDDSNNTLSGIASAINSASDNPGIAATVVNGADGQHLVLRSTSTGLANAINVTVDSSDSALSSLGVTSGTSTTDPNDPNKTVTAYTTIATGGSNWTQTSSGQDAHLTIAGTAVTSASNTIKNAVSGVSMTLTADSVSSSPQTLTISQDTDNLKTAITSFVTAYNNFISTASTLTSYDSTASSQGALLGDSMMNTIKNTISSLVSKGIGSGATKVNLASIGITLQPDGSLSTDENALTDALTNKSSTVASLFNTTDGVAAQMNNNLTSFLATGGIIDTRTTALNDDLSSIADQQTQLTAYTAQLTTDYNAQFTALNTLMSSMSTQSSYLTALFGGTNSAGALATNKS